ncbi:quercetin dioxygenase-like cupin family protein [Catenuloplanes nepalensis]|uniref:Quercetin dioxygenase-like cupin family protein n=1 Tax=Catenuloplanes nepalensis TaxID=587533 RepID=A0ABT9MRH9_9ACTN|nr:cupin domain-containing protein [Catenuloplanes nepalensis]MDP9794035.1 quercetin dioxygenase-like cupin family protein [Catenuloplanes nepalensis]
MTHPYAAQADDHQKLEWLGGGVMEVLLDGERTGGQLAVFRSQAPAGAASPAHVHSREDEIFVLLSGSAVFWIGDRRFEAGEGSVAFLPRGVPHAYRITEDADLFAVSTPAGLENFFRGAGHDLSLPRPEGFTVTPATMAAAAAANGQTILGPPLAVDGVLPRIGTGATGVPYVAGAGEHETVEWIGGGLMRILLAAEHTGAQLAMFRSSAPAGAASPVYTHAREHEIILMLSGSGVYWVGEHRFELTAGGLVLVPRGVPMAHRITADAEILALTTPGGLEAFFRTVGRDVREPRPDGWEIDYELMGRASEATGQTVLGPPLEVGDMIRLP